MGFLIITHTQKKLCMSESFNTRIQHQFFIKNLPLRFHNTHPQIQKVILFLQSNAGLKASFRDLFYTKMSEFKIFIVLSFYLINFQFN